MVQVTGYAMYQLSPLPPDFNSVWAGGHGNRVPVLYALHC